ncbi:MAG: 23S rRNA (guanosine(2251)-2'-O)-methyltransferase RlmB [Nitrospirota bacterium]
MMIKASKEVIYGINPVYEVLKKAENRSIYGVYVIEEKRGKEIDRIAELCKKRKIDLKYVSHNFIEKLLAEARGQRVVHQGVVALTTSKCYSTIDKMLNIAKSKGGKPLLLALDGIEDPRNLGAVIRTADAGGVHGIILTRHHTVALTPIVAKTSAGALEYVAVTVVTNLRATLSALKKKGLWILGLENTASQSIYSLDLDIPLVVVIGGENTGLRKGIVEECDFLGNIPMYGHINSLNLSVATGVVIYEILNQRLLIGEKTKGKAKKIFKIN